jgi:hypothetical protein
VIGKSDIRNTRRDLLEWISPGPYSITHDGLRKKRAPNSGTWLLECRDFLPWISDSTHTLLCSGIGSFQIRVELTRPSEIREDCFDVEHLHYNCSPFRSVVGDSLHSTLGSDIAVAYIYFDYKD